MWAIPDALIQLIGGPKRQLGILLATCLLINNAMASWAVVVGIVLRIVIIRVWGERGRSPMGVMAAGFITGEPSIASIDITRYRAPNRFC